MVRGIQNRGAVQIDVFQVLVPLVLLQQGQAGFKAVTGKPGFVDVTPAGRVDDHVMVVTDFPGRTVVDRPFLGHFLISQDDGFHRNAFLHGQFMRLFQFFRHVCFVLTGGFLTHLGQFFMNLGHGRIHLELHHGFLSLVILFFEFPTQTHDDRAFIDTSTHVFIDECHLVDLGIELVIQHQLVLLCGIPIFPGHRSHIE